MPCLVHLKYVIPTLYSRHKEHTYSHSTCVFYIQGISLILLILKRPVLYKKVKYRVAQIIGRLRPRNAKLLIIEHISQTFEMQSKR